MSNAFFLGKRGQQNADPCCSVVGEARVALSVKIGFPISPFHSSVYKLFGGPPQLKHYEDVNLEFLTIFKSLESVGEELGRFETEKFEFGTEGSKFVARVVNSSSWEILH